MTPISIFGGGDATTIDDVVSRTALARADGFRSIWFGQAYGVDTLTALAVAAREVPSIKIGTAVVPVQGRHPFLLAQQALTVAQAAGGDRFTLGLGASHRPFVESSLHIPYRGAVGHVEAMVSRLVPTLRQPRITEVQTYASGSGIGVRADPPQVVLAALGSRMLEIAGRLADGTVTWMTGPRGLKSHVVPEITAASDAAARRSPRVIVGVHVCLADRPAAAKSRLAPRFDALGSLDSYAAALRREQLSCPVDVAAIGGAGLIEDRLLALCEAGATEIIVIPVGEASEQDGARAAAVAMSKAM